MSPDTLSAMLREISNELRADWIAGRVPTRQLMFELGRTLAACAISARDLEDRAQGQVVPAILPENVVPFRRRCA